MALDAEAQVGHGASGERSLFAAGGTCEAVDPYDEILEGGSQAEGVVA